MVGKKREGGGSEQEKGKSFESEYLSRRNNEERSEANKEPKQDSVKRILVPPLLMYEARHQNLWDTLWPSLSAEENR
jgi:hypothetical protein